MPNAFIKPSTGSPTYDLERVQFQCCSRESHNYPKGQLFRKSVWKEPGLVLSFGNVFSSVFIASRNTQEGYNKEPNLMKYYSLDSYLNLTNTDFHIKEGKDTGIF